MPAETLTIMVAATARISVKGSGGGGRVRVATGSVEASEEKAADNPLDVIVALYVPSGIMGRFTVPFSSVMAWMPVWLANVTSTWAPETGFP